MRHDERAMRRIGAAATGARAALMVCAAALVMCAPLAAHAADGGAGANPEQGARQGQGAGEGRPDGAAPQREGEPRTGEGRVQRPPSERGARPALPDFGGCPYRNKPLDLIV